MVSPIRPNWVKPGMHYYKLIYCGSGKIFVLFRAEENDDIAIDRYEMYQEDTVKQRVKELNGWNK